MGERSVGRNSGGKEGSVSPWQVFAQLVMRLEKDSIYPAVWRDLFKGSGGSTTTSPASPGDTLATLTHHTSRHTDVIILLRSSL